MTMPPTARVIRVIEVYATTGKGTSEDPVRRVLYLFSVTGEQIAVVDDWLADAPVIPPSVQAIVQRAFGDR